MPLISAVLEAKSLLLSPSATIHWSPPPETMLFVTPTDSAGIYTYAMCPLAYSHWVGSSDINNTKFQTRASLWRNLLWGFRVHEVLDGGGGYSLFCNGHPGFEFVVTLSRMTSRRRKKEKRAAVFIDFVRFKLKFKLLRKMPETRRHSVDVPLSKALMTLKRVRSLRDPSTISMSKFPASVNYINWDSVSYNGSVLDFKYLGALEHQRSRLSCSDGKEEEQDNQPESAKSSRICDTNLSSFDQSSKKRNGECRRKPMDVTWIPKPNELYEDEADSYNETRMDQGKKINSIAIQKKKEYNTMRKLSTAVEGASISRIGSPYMSQSEAQTNRSSNCFSIFQNDDGNAVESNYSGCGLSSCWSRTPKLKDANHYSDLDEQECPLLSTERRDPTYMETTLCLDSLRSLSQKYRPKSFDELAGQHVVAESLISAISRGKISPVYVFHGPRGTGKTSMARVFAAALNCLSLEAYRPCGFCRECVFLFSGRSRDVKELHGSKLNRKDRIKALLKSASLSPHSSSFKVFIIDECEFLQEQAWPTILNSLQEILRQVVCIMVTSELDKLPQSSISRCQRYHFPKIKDADIVCRLQRICVEEVLEFDKEALDCIASKSNGSLRDAEIMLDQLSLLGKRITSSLAYELIGIVSDDELIDLLNLALSSDASNTVRRARELMSSKVDPMQLVSQLANLIMDILSGRCLSGLSQAARNFLEKHTFAEVGLQKLRHVLKILSETEKQLRTTKNQATWLTAALLQFSSEESLSVIDSDDPRSFLKTGSCLRDDGLCCAVSPRDSQKHSSTHSNIKCSDEQCSCFRKLEIIWRRTIEKCPTNSLKNLLLKQGKLSSVYVGQGVAIVEIQFSTHDHVSKAEKSWKEIASLLQSVLGCNVEIRIKLFPFKKTMKLKKATFGFLSCSGRRQDISESEMETSMRREGCIQAYSDDHGQYLSPVTQLSEGKLLDGARFSHSKEAFTIRDSEGNALNSGPHTSIRHSCAAKGYSMGSDGSRDIDEEHKYLNIQDTKHQSCCFAKLRRLPLKFSPSYTSRMKQLNKLEPSIIPNKESLHACFCSKAACALCVKPDTQMTYSSCDDELSSRNKSNSSTWHCWGAPKSSIRKGWQQMQHQSRCHSVGWILPCLSSKQFPQSIAVEEHA